MKKMIKECTINLYVRKTKVLVENSSVVIENKTIMTLKDLVSKISGVDYLSVYF